MCELACVNSYHWQLDTTQLVSRVVGEPIAESRVVGEPLNDHIRVRISELVCVNLYHWRLDTTRLVSRVVGEPIAESRVVGEPNHLARSAVIGTDCHPANLAGICGLQVSRVVLLLFITFLEKCTATFSSYLSLKRNPVFGASAQRISRPSYTAVVVLNRPLFEIIRRFET
jgi:hypothetical protein